MGKKLTRSPMNKKIAGVCSGIADYFGIDVSIVRVIWLFLILIHGSGLLLYLLCWAIIPEGPEIYY